MATIEIEFLDTNHIAPKPIQILYLDINDENDRPHITFTTDAAWMVLFGLTVMAISPVEVLENQLHEDVVLNLDGSTSAVTPAPGSNPATVISNHNV
jgi:hypothetical protein